MTTKELFTIVVTDIRSWQDEFNNDTNSVIQLIELFKNEIFKPQNINVESVLRGDKVIDVSPEFLNKKYSFIVDFEHGSKEDVDTVLEDIELSLNEHFIEVDIVFSVLKYDGYYAIDFDDSNANWYEANSIIF